MHVQYVKTCKMHVNVNVNVKCKILHTNPAHTQHTQTTTNTDRPNKAEGRNAQEGSRVKRAKPGIGSQGHGFTARVYSRRAAAARRAAWRAASEA